MKIYFKRHNLQVRGSKLKRQWSLSASFPLLSWLSILKQWLRRILRYATAKKSWKHRIRSHSYNSEMNGLCWALLLDLVQTSHLKCANEFNQYCFRLFALDSARLNEASPFCSRHIYIIYNEVPQNKQDLTVSRSLIVIRRFDFWISKFFPFSWLNQVFLMHRWSLFWLRLSGG